MTENSLIFKTAEAVTVQKLSALLCSETQETVNSFAEKFMQPIQQEYDGTA